MSRRQGVAIEASSNLVLLSPPGPLAQQVKENAVPRRNLPSILMGIVAVFALAARRAETIPARTQAAPNPEAG